MGILQFSIKIKQKIIHFSTFRELRLRKPICWSTLFVLKERWVSTSSLLFRVLNFITGFFFILTTLFVSPRLIFGFLTIGERCGVTLFADLTLSCSFF